MFKDFAKWYYKLDLDDKVFYAFVGVLVSFFVLMMGWLLIDLFIHFFWVTLAFFLVISLLISIAWLINVYGKKLTEKK